MKAIVHIGAEKTGTSSLQEFCSRNRSLMAAAGVLYPSSPGAVNHLRLTAYALNDEKIDDIRLFLGLRTSEDIAAFRAEFPEALAKEVADTPGIETLLFSNEHLQSRLIATDEVERLRELISTVADKIRVLVYLRRQDQVAVSHYSTRLKSDSDLADAVFPDWDEMEQPPAYYDYDAMLKRYEAVFGAENVTVRLFERSRFFGRELLRDFRTVSRIPQGPDYVGVAVENQSLSPVGLQFYRRFNQQVPRFVDGALNPLRSGINPTMMKRFSGSGPRVARNEAEAFFNRFREGNRAIAQRYFPGEPETLFNDDFSSYDSPNAALVTGNDLVDLAIHLWLDRTAAMEELRLENYLLKFEVAFRTSRLEDLPPLLKIAPGPTVSTNLVAKYLGAVLISGDFKHGVAVAESQLEEPFTPQAMALGRAFALLCLGDKAALASLLDQPRIPPKVRASINDLMAAELGPRRPMKWMAYFREGDALQQIFHKRCLQWLE